MFCKVVGFHHRHRSYASADLHTNWSQTGDAGPHMQPHKHSMCAHHIKMGEHAPCQSLLKDHSASHTINSALLWDSRDAESPYKRQLWRHATSRSMHITLSMQEAEKCVHQRECSQRVGRLTLKCTLSLYYSAFLPSLLPCCATSSDSGRMTT